MAMKGIEEVVSTVGAMLPIGGGEKDAIDLLKADHRKVEMLFTQFERARSAANKQSLLDQILKELSVHATIEENIVYPLLKDSRKVGEKTAEAYEEHHLMKMAIAELADIPADKEVVKAKVCVLREVVRHHVKEEEKDMLPQLKNTGVDLDRLAADILRRKKQLMAGIARGGGVGKNKDAKATKSSASVRKTKSSSTSSRRKSTTSRRKKSA